MHMQNIKMALLVPIVKTQVLSSPHARMEMGNNT